MVELQEVGELRVLTGRRVGAAILIVGWSPELGWSTANEQPLSFTGKPEARHTIDAFATCGHLACACRSRGRPTLGTAIRSP